MDPTHGSTDTTSQHTASPLDAMDQKKPQPLRRVSSPISTGAIAGSAEVLFMHPTLIWKNCRQLRQPFPTTIRALYQGFPLSLALSVPMFALMHGTNGLVAQAIGGETERERKRAQAVATITSAASVTLSLHGVEGLIIQKNKQSSGWPQLIRSTWQQHGYRLFSRGATASFARNLSYCGGMYLAVQPLTNLFCCVYTDKLTPEKRNYLETTAAVLSGGLFGFIAHPCDTVKTFLQDDLGAKKFKNTHHVCKYGWQKQGIRWFYKGMVPHFVRFSIGTGIFHWAAKWYEDAHTH